MIIQAFLRWVETARAGDRAKAANALAKAYLRPDLDGEQRRAALLAMCHLLDDPSPQVRLALAQALDSPLAPREVILALAEDQPEIACTVITTSPLLLDKDLVDLAATGGPLRRGFIAARAGLGRGVCAALAEVGEESTAIVLLENVNAEISRRSLSRIAERFGHCETVRRLLLERDDLPADARQTIVAHVSDALAGSHLVQMVLPQGRLERMMGEACEMAAVAIAGKVHPSELPGLIEHLRSTEKLTPALLLHALCTGKTDFLSAAMVSLCGLDERRVRALLSSGRMHAVRALFESAGLPRDLATIFVQATLLQRQGGEMTRVENVCSRLLEICPRPQDPDSPTAQLLDLVETLQRSGMREVARSYAQDVLLAA